MKAKSTEDAVIIIHNGPHHSEKETEGFISESKTPLKISIDEESWTVWEEVSIVLRDKFAD